MNSLIQGLQGVNISAGQLLFWIVAIVSAIGALYKYLEKYRKVKNEIETYKETVAKHGTKLETLENEVKAMKTNFETDFKKMKEDEDNDFRLLNSKLDELGQAIKEMQEYNKQRDIADLKDRIRNLYDRYHARGNITRTEKETLMDLVSSYMKAGGNSFVKELIIPEIPTWKEID